MELLASGGERRVQIGPQVPCSLLCLSQETNLALIQTALLLDIEGTLDRVSDGIRLGLCSSSGPVLPLSQVLETFVHRRAARTTHAEKDQHGRENDFHHPHVTKLDPRASFLVREDGP